MGRELPSARSTYSLTFVVCFAFLFMQRSEANTVFTEKSAIWLVTWFLLLVMQMTYGKWITDELNMTHLERVFYTNSFAIPVTAALCVFSDDLHNLNTVHLSSKSVIWISISCFVGFGISYSGWRARSLFTATTFALVGVLNKLLTIAVAAVIWTSDRAFSSVACLVLCILAGAFYEEAPLRSKIDRN
jgi:hypothetical protein